MWCPLFKKNYYLNLKQQSSLGVDYGKLIPNGVQGYLSAKFRYQIEAACRPM